MDLTRSELLDVGLDVLEADPTDLPAGMGDRVLAAATARPRPALHPTWSSDIGLTSLDTVISTAAELGHLVESLSAEDWAQATEVGDGVSVRDLVLHLIGVERYLLGQLGMRAPILAPRPADHYPMLRAAAADFDGATTGEIARAWWREALELIGACSRLGPDHAVTHHHIAGSVRGMLVVRTFEMWTHDDDIRRAVGLAPNQLDDDRLRLMSAALVGSLAGGMALMGTTQKGRTAHIELTGAGGGTSFDIALAYGDDAGPVDLAITVDALDLCRLASNRMPIDRIDLDVEGDSSLLEPVLVGATAFALD